MSWNYRIVKELPAPRERSMRGRFLQAPEPTYSIREIYYDGEDDTKFSWTAGPRGVAAEGTTFDDLRADFDRQALAFNRPVIVIRDETVLGEVEGPAADRFVR